MNRQLSAIYIKNFSKPGDIVLDPFGGTGVTAIEAHFGYAYALAFPLLLTYVFPHPERHRRRVAYSGKKEDNYCVKDNKDCCGKIILKIRKSEK